MKKKMKNSFQESLNTGRSCWFMFKEKRCLFDGKYWRKWSLEEKEVHPKTNKKTHEKKREVVREDDKVKVLVKELQGLQIVSGDSKGDWRFLQEHEKRKNTMLLWSWKRIQCSFTPTQKSFPRQTSSWAAWWGRTSRWPTAPWSRPTFSATSTSPWPASPGRSMW